LADCLCSLFQITSHSSNNFISDENTHLTTNANNTKETEEKSEKDTHENLQKKTGVADIYRAAVDCCGMLMSYEVTVFEFTSHTSPQKEKEKEKEKEEFVFPFLWKCILFRFGIPLTITNTYGEKEAESNPISHILSASEDVSLSLAILSAFLITTKMLTQQKVIFFHNFFLNDKLFDVIVEKIRSSDERKSDFSDFFLPKFLFFLFTLVMELKEKAEDICSENYVKICLTVFEYYLGECDFNLTDFYYIRSSGLIGREKGEGRREKGEGRREKGEGRGRGRRERVREEGSQNFIKSFVFVCVFV
jgi:hypothetical protein